MILIQKIFTKEVMTEVYGMVKWFCGESSSAIRMISGETWKVCSGKN